MLYKFSDEFYAHSFLRLWLVQPEFISATGFLKTWLLISHSWYREFAFNLFLISFIDYFVRLVWNNLINQWLLFRFRKSETEEKQNWNFKRIEKKGDGERERGQRIMKIVCWLCSGVYNVFLYATVKKRPTLFDEPVPSLCRHNRPSVVALISFLLHVSVFVINY